ncbi:hypothetical protein ACQJBY_054116 [Aegilops geniculata]
MRTRGATATASAANTELPEGKEQRIREVKQPEEPENTISVQCTGHIPHGFYKDQMQGFFQELGAIKKRVSIARNHKPFHSRHHFPFVWDPIPKMLGSVGLAFY